MTLAVGQAVTVVDSFGQLHGAVVVDRPRIAGRIAVEIHGRLWSWPAQDVFTTRKAAEAARCALQAGSDSARKLRWP